MSAGERLTTSSDGFFGLFSSTGSIFGAGFGGFGGVLLLLLLLLVMLLLVMLLLVMLLLLLLLLLLLVKTCAGRSRIL